MTRDDARTHVLGQIRVHLSAARAGEAAPEAPSGSGEVGQCAMPEDVAGRVARFKSVLETVGGEVTIAADHDEAASALRHIVATRHVRRLAVSDDDLVSDFAADLQDVELVASDDREALLGCDAGLSGAQWGVAETGSLVLSSAAERHRLVSLLPTVHVALLRATRILGGLDEALRHVADAGPDGLPRALTFVTGPSRTADIELTLVVGVHGPKELHVIVLQEDIA
ncbi:MAG: lactate utilization protein [Planctomycetota bacterium]|nr:lactate utilization protein [Planctomycetota bacterium]